MVNALYGTRVKADRLGLGAQHARRTHAHVAAGLQSRRTQSPVRLQQEVADRKLSVGSVRDTELDCVLPTLLA
jgi:hypothetical protein